MSETIATDGNTGVQWLSLLWLVAKIAVCVWFVMEPLQVIVVAYQQF